MLLFSEFPGLLLSVRPCGNEHHELIVNGRKWSTCIILGLLPVSMGISRLCGNLKAKAGSKVCFSLYLSLFYVFIILLLLVVAFPFKMHLVLLTALTSALFYHRSCQHLIGPFWEKKSSTGIIIFTIKLYWCNTVLKTAIDFERALS